MDDLLGIIIFIVVFVLGPIIEQIRRKGQSPRQPPQQQRRPAEMRPRAQPQPQQQLPTPAPAPRSETEDASAATMLPDDLWEVLTGQPRPQTQPAPQRVPAPAPDVEWEDIVDEEELVRDDVDIEKKRSTFEEAVSLETLTRHPEPVVVSMEAVFPEPRARHVAFHKKIDQTAAPVAVTVERRVRRPPLAGREQLRNAVLLQTILGRPKALE
jgi:hypothetical protein